MATVRLPGNRRDIVFAISTLLMVLLFLTGVLPPDSRPNITNAFDETLLAFEPLPIGDLRGALGYAAVTAKQGEWRLAERLIRDARAQWDAFYHYLLPGDNRYHWTTADIKRAAALFDTAVKQVGQRNVKGTLRAVQQLETVMNKYRMHALQAG